MAGNYPDGVTQAMLDEYYNQGPLVEEEEWDLEFDPEESDELLEADTKDFENWIDSIVTDADLPF